jgi:hypothetical protein
MSVALIPQPEGMKSIKQNARKAFALQLNIDAGKRIALDGTRANGNWSVLDGKIYWRIFSSKKKNE